MENAVYVKSALGEEFQKRRKEVRVLLSLTRRAFLVSQRVPAADSSSFQGTVALAVRTAFSLRLVVSDWNCHIYLLL